MTSNDSSKATLPWHRRKWLRGALASVAGLAGMVAYTIYWEPHWVQVVRRPLPIASLPETLVGKTLVQLSDIHISSRVSDDYLKRCFELVAELSPEIVVTTGDFTTYGTRLERKAAPMFPYFPHGNLATLGILGNHDYGHPTSEAAHAAELVELASASQIRILRNEIADVAGLQIVGFDDLWAQRFDLAEGLAALKADGAMLALTHNPDTVDLPGWEPFRGWILAGHTHGGQCKPPFLPPPLLPVKNRRYTCGEFSLPGERTLYINRGLGHLTKARFNVRPEITVFELARA
jgi:predicted MPP superfamily phosphohydrolase